MCQHSKNLANNKILSNVYKYLSKYAIASNKQSNENHLLVEYQFQLVQNIYSFLLAYIFNRYWVRFQPALPMLCFN
jgi:hypothetical protein